jgi:hypothetical protein
METTPKPNHDQLPINGEVTGDVQVPNPQPNAEVTSQPTVTGAEEGSEAESQSPPTASPAVQPSHIEPQVPSVAHARHAVEEARAENSPNENELPAVPLSQPGTDTTSAPMPAQPAHHLTTEEEDTGDLEIFDDERKTTPHPESHEQGSSSQIEADDEDLNIRALEAYNEVRLNDIAGTSTVVESVPHEPEVPSGDEEDIVIPPQPMAMPDLHRREPISTQTTRPDRAAAVPLNNSDETAQLEAWIRQQSLTAELPTSRGAAEARPRPITVAPTPSQSNPHWLENPNNDINRASQAVQPTLKETIIKAVTGNAKNKAAKALQKQYYVLVTGRPRSLLHPTGRQWVRLDRVTHFDLLGATRETPMRHGGFLRGTRATIEDFVPVMRRGSEQQANASRPFQRTTTTTFANTMTAPIHLAPLPRTTRTSTPFPGRENKDEDGDDDWRYI